MRRACGVGRGSACRPAWPRDTGIFLVVWGECVAVIVGGVAVVSTARVVVGIGVVVVGSALVGSAVGVAGTASVSGVVVGIAITVVTGVGRVRRNLATVEGSHLPLVLAVHFLRKGRQVNHNGGRGQKTSTKVGETPNNHSMRGRSGNI